MKDANPNITSRLMAPVAIRTKDNSVASVDLGAFVRRILLFETYILHTGWLEDLSLLATVLDECGIEQLLNAGALKLHCGVFAIGQTGQVRADLEFSDKSTRLPPCSYSFSSIQVQGREEKIERALRQFGPDLQNEARTNILEVPQEFFTTTFSGFYADIRSNPEVVECAIKLRLENLGIKPKRLKLNIEETASEDFRVGNNLCDEYGLSTDDAHKLIEGALLAVGGLNQRFAEMMTFSALSGTGKEDLPIMGGKLAMVARLTTSCNHEQRFDRILDIAGLPSPRIGEGKIDAKTLLRIRDSDECRAFRDWLGRTDSLSDAELKERLTGFRARIREALNSRIGKGIRFVISNGLGLLGPVTGLTTSAVDAFILERLAPKDAVLAFLSDSYKPLLRNVI